MTHRRLNAGIGEPTYKDWMRDEARRLTEGPDAAADGRIRWIECSDLGIDALSVNLRFRRDTLLEQDVPPGHYLSLVGHCDFIPRDALQSAVREFNHTLAAVELNRTVPDPVHFKSGGRLQMIRLRLTRLPGGSSWMPCGKDTPFRRDAAYQTARLLPLPPVLHSLCSQLWLCDWTDHAGDLYAQAKIREILAHLVTQPWLQSEHDRDARLVAGAQAIICGELDVQWTLDAMARRLGTNERYLKQAFRRRLGVGLATWLRQTRMETARRWLDETTWPVTRIAMQLGYSAAGRFAAAFERHHGMVPSQYRQRIPGKEL